MWAIAGIIAVIIAIIMFEAPSLRRKQLRKELWVFSILLLIGFGLGVAISLHMKLPPALDWIIVIYKPLTDALIGLLK
ncbi:hypothetical protein [Cohnella luojiensis]|uniref:Uncharacterized protein n=1 Tax=Cohnella luojiensis TaxID=652876 RepID=A0A4Y8LX32_9BACL|nr:hypothetical protein [Cohnella luojiensis]TFE26627.1 hypothetical protein E2980_10930 [Cohnella luojiensis]